MNATPGEATDQDSLARRVEGEIARRISARIPHHVDSAPSHPQDTLLAVFSELIHSVALARGIQSTDGPAEVAAWCAPWAHDLTSEQLSRAYEELLEQPATTIAGRSHARRRSGAYYTPPSAVVHLMERAIDPLIARALEQRAVSQQEAALLSLRICDPACGTGHILVAAAHRIATALARLRGEPKASHATLAEVAASCIYGVDQDALAATLCRFALQLESGRVIAQLHSNIRVGNSLIGSTPFTPGPSVPLLRTFDWAGHFPEVFACAGFDAVIGNPPWIAHAGRAAQPLPNAERSYHLQANPAFAGYRTTHGMFVRRSAELIAPGGRLALVLPTSVADLDGYAPTRRALAELCDVDPELTDLGDGVFEDVFQPSMILSASRRPASTLATGEQWTLARSDVTHSERTLLAKLAGLPVMPRGAFGERGLQTNPAMRARLRSAPSPSHAVAVRDGSSVTEFTLSSPTTFAALEDLEAWKKGPGTFKDVSVVVRQTARFPIAAVHDGSVFRNSLLAAFALPPCTPGSLAAYLNSTLVRWHHYQRFRDARQGMPQVKVAHLRSIPWPEAMQLAETHATLASLHHAQDRGAIDAVVNDAFALSPSERALIDGWGARVLPARNDRLKANRPGA